jgi:peptide/nickel transport system ATP-binding protein
VNTTPPTPPLLDLDDIRVSYRTGAGDREAVRGVSLTVGHGEFVTVVGESGSGKSTLIQAALGLLPDNARVGSGRIRLWGHDVTDLDDDIMAQVRGNYVSFVPQDPATSLNPVKRIGQQVEDAVALAGGADDITGRRTTARRALELAGLHDVDRVSGKFPHELSGGMKQRVLIAVALAGGPRLIIADEPTSALDVTVQKNILDHLKSLQRELGIGVLLVTHDIGVALERSDRILVLRHGAAVESGEPRDLLYHPGQDYTRELLAAAPTLGSEPLTATTDAADAADGGGPGHGDVVLGGAGLTRVYQGRGGESFTALSDVSVGVRRGTTHAVVGESGAGKSTLARILAGFDEPTAGTVEVDGRPLPGSGRTRRRSRNSARRTLYRNLQYVLQNPFTSLDPRFTVRRIIAEPLRAFRLGDRATIDNRVREVLSLVALDPELLERRPTELSGGQRQRVAIARALAIEPQILILDEAVSALDVSVQAGILQLLADLQERLGLTYLFITHDLGVVRQIAHAVTVMQQGQVVETGPVGEIFDNPTHPYTRTLLAAVADPERTLTSVAA